MGDDGLTIQISRDGRVGTVAAAGELDLSTVGELRAAVFTAVADCDRLVLDMSGIGFIDSAGLGALLELQSTLHRKVVSFEIVAGDGPVRQAVQTTGLSQLLATH